VNATGKPYQEDKLTIAIQQERRNQTEQEHTAGLEKPAEHPFGFAHIHQKIYKHHFKTKVHTLLRKCTINKQNGTPKERPTSAT